MRNRWNLTGRQALVVGGTKNIGRAVANELSALGAAVPVVARNLAVECPSPRRHPRKHGGALVRAHAPHRDANNPTRFAAKM